MAATLDLPAVRRFTDELKDRARRCDNGEGMICSNLDETIRHYLQLCVELRGYINEWARAIFEGQLTFDPAVEDLLKDEVRSLLRHAKRIAALGRAMCQMCVELPGLDPLHFNIADFDFLLENWVSPRLSVNPAARVKLPAATQRQIIENLNKLSPLPSDWKPTDPVQLALFQKQGGK